MKSVSLPIFSEVKAAATVLQGQPWLRLAFRPFYLAGASFAALAVPVWVAMFLGYLKITLTVAPMLWHAHEMLFGFAAAIIVGFLMTAGKNWTGLATPRGPWLGALVLLWLAARISAWVGPYALYAVLDLALLPLVAAVLVTLLLRAGNHRNLPLAVILALLTVANLTFHLAVMGVISVSPMAGLYGALALIVMIECVMAGRVVPAFTMGVTPGLKIVTNQWVERITLGTTAVGLALWVLLPPNLVASAVLALAAVLHVGRVLSWRPLVTRQRPILWILHAAYFWIAIGLGLLALAQIGLVPASAGVHALAVGATGGLIIGMITRTARGHTGRPILASKLEVLAYALVLSAAALRVFLPLLAPEMLVLALVIAATAWTIAFVIYLFKFTPWLLATRLDGKDG
jgi:uncharacterized protein involved in response to NO